MPRKKPLTRAERRAARQPDGPHVHGLTILDAGAQGWVSWVVFFARDAEDAIQRRRTLGLHKRVERQHPFPSEQDNIPAEARRLAEAHPDQAFMSQHNDDGWSPWFALPPNYVHPSQGRAAKYPELRLEQPPPGGTTWEFRQP